MIGELITTYQACAQFTWPFCTNRTYRFTMSLSYCRNDRFTVDNACHTTLIMCTFLQIENARNNVELSDTTLTFHFFRSCYHSAVRCQKQQNVRIRILTNDSDSSSTTETWLIFSPRKGQKSSVTFGHQTRHLPVRVRWIPRKPIGKVWRVVDSSLDFLLRAWNQSWSGWSHWQSRATQLVCSEPAARIPPLNKLSPPCKRDNCKLTFRMLASKLA